MREDLRDVTRARPPQGNPGRGTECAQLATETQQKAARVMGAKPRRGGEAGQPLHHIRQREVCSHWIKIGSACWDSPRGYCLDKSVLA